MIKLMGILMLVVAGAFVIYYASTAQPATALVWGALFIALVYARGTEDDKHKR